MRHDRKITTALLTAAIGALALAPTSAQADWHGRHHGYYGHHHHHGGGGTAAAAGVGLLGGLIAGAAIADSNRRSECHIERRRVIAPNGVRRVRDVEVCD